MIKHARCILWGLYVIWKCDHISRRNRLRLSVKTIRLYLCCLAFTDPDHPISQLRGAIINGFLTAIYDYDTDWVRVADVEGSMSFRLLDQHTSGEANEIAKDLFRRDWGDELSDHGLERGGTSFRFYYLMIRSRWLSQYSPDEHYTFGEGLQIVDDILDWEKDQREGDKNCFLTENRLHYVSKGLAFLGSEFFARLRSRLWVYRYVYRKCRQKLKIIERG